MHPPRYSSRPLPSTHCPDRREVARILDRTDRGQAAGQPVTEMSALEGVPRSNFYYWRSRRQRIDAPWAVREFFESSDGLELLHRVYTAALFDFVQSRGCGVDAVAEFLRLSQLDRYAAASHGSVYQQTGAMERQIVGYGKQEQRRLGAQMEARRIAVCEDETFHQGDPCLVAMEPVSGYLLVEHYAEKRDAATWDAALRKGTLRRGARPPPGSRRATARLGQRPRHARPHRATAHRGRHQRLHRPLRPKHRLR